MVSAHPTRPAADEYIPYYGRYITLVPDGDLVTMLTRQGEEMAALLASFSPAQASYRPAPGEWNTLEIVGHITDMERVFAYRVLRLARRDTQPIEGVDDVDSYVTAADFAERPLTDVAAEFAAVRQASVALYRSLDALAWARMGTVDGHPISARALGYITAGHGIHHLPDIRRYRDLAG